MIVLWLVRWRETNISSATATSDSRMISAEKGSILVRTAISLNSRGDDEVADSIHAHPLTGIDDSRGGRLLDDGGAHHLFFQTQPLALVECCVMAAVLVEVDLAPALAGRTRARWRRERGEVGVGDAHQPGQVEIDELHRRLEAAHEGGLMPLVEPSR